MATAVCSLPAASVADAVMRALRVMPPTGQEPVAGSAVAVETDQAPDWTVVRYVSGGVVDE
jgi:hypothetical protein